MVSVSYTGGDSDVDFYNICKILEHSPRAFKDPEILLFMIVELVSSTCYSSILYNEPTDIESFKPFLFEAIRLLVRSQEL